MRDMAALSREFQLLLEHHRARPDCEETWQLFRRARGELERAWLESLVRA